MSQIRWVVEGRLARACRPGYAGKDVGRAAVDEWIQEAKTLGIRTIICLLSGRQLRYYPSMNAEGGLIARYKAEGFAVAHIPVDDHKSPPLSPAELDQVAQAFVDATEPVLVHCSAGIDRTGQAVDFLKGCTL